MSRIETTVVEFALLIPRTLAFLRNADKHIQELITTIQHAHDENQVQ